MTHQIVFFPSERTLMAERRRCEAPAFIFRLLFFKFCSVKSIEQRVDVFWQRMMALNPPWPVLRASASKCSKTVLQYFQTNNAGNEKKKKKEEVL